jgi:hypothetical protein
VRLRERSACSELPIIPEDTTTASEEYWPDRVSRAGFTVAAVE